MLPKESTVPKPDFANQSSRTMKPLTNPKHLMQGHGDRWQAGTDGRAGCICGAEEMSLNRFNIACDAVASFGRQLHNRQRSSTRRARRTGCAGDAKTSCHSKFMEKSNLAFQIQPKQYL
jgi:hypothetical protein